MWAIYRRRWFAAVIGFVPFASLIIFDFGLSDNDLDGITYPLNVLSSVSYALYGGQVESKLKKEDG